MNSFALDNVFLFFEKLFKKWKGPLVNSLYAQKFNEIVWYKIEECSLCHFHAKEKGCNIDHSFFNCICVHVLPGLDNL